MGTSRTVRRKRNKDNAKPGKIILLFLLGVIVVFSLSIAYGYNILEGFSKDSVSSKRVELNQPVNILLLGVDAGDYENKSKNNPKRSDTMILLRYNPVDNKLYMLSIPRDTRVSINGHTTKINTAHATGGPELAIQTVEKLLSLTVNYYVKLDYEGFRRMVDAIGGIDVVIPRDMDYDAQDIHIHFKKGEKVHLDGQGAEEFVRWRKNNDGGGYAMGDIGRQETQQQFLIKIVEKLKSAQGIIRMPVLLKTASQYIQTNIAPADLMKYALKVRNINTGDIEKQNLSGEPKYINGISYYIWDKNLKDDFLIRYRINGISKNNSDGLERSGVKITILNSTGVSGHAAKYKSMLEEKGYRIIETGNYSKKLETSRIEYYTSEEIGEDIFSSLGKGNVIKGSSNSSGRDIIIILGNDSLE